MTYLNSDFNSLPVLQVLSARKTDDEVAFESDMAYFKNLLNDLVLQASMGGHRSPWPADLSYHFAWLEAQVADV